MGSGKIKAHAFGVIHELRALHPLWMLLSIAVVSRSGYYQWKNRPHTEKTSQNIKLEKQLLSLYTSRPYYGYRRLTTALRKKGWLINHKRVYRLMKQKGIRSVIRKKRTHFLNSSESHIYPNLLKRKFQSDSSLTKFVTDVTTLPVLSGNLYLCAVQDLHNNEIIGYGLSKRNDTELVTSTLRMLKLPRKKEVMMHSDQGFQFTSHNYRNELHALQLHGSHSRKGNCYDNACIESFFSHFKTEAFASFGKKLRTEEKMKSIVHEYMHFYNTERFQKKLGQLSPVEYRKKHARLSVGA